MDKPKHAPKIFYTMPKKIILFIIQSSSSKHTSVFNLIETISFAQSQHLAEDASDIHLLRVVDARWRMLRRLMPSVIDVNTHTSVNHCHRGIEDDAAKDKW